ncbi:MAG TPA: GNAT family N-acetyltransferase [Lacunisphaera sp.]|jgi:RimJ/RimL family protein N-acetyltransferase|nr:GNAT family N-acetyltransferase [Lacunisphaera sp.]
MVVLQTRRLTLRELTLGDAPFILELLNDPTWLRFIGDRGVRDLDSARAYITGGPAASYAQHGFGLWLVERRQDGVPIGICGLLKRDTLPDVDIGFAFLERYQGQGYGSEAAVATMAHARDVLGLKKIVAVTVPGNTGSIRILEKLGLRYERMVELKPGMPPIMLYG